MKLIVMRHGEAEAASSSDKNRNLTEHGIRQTQLASKWLSRHVLNNEPIDVALVSPYVRAQQTFEYLKPELCFTQKIDCSELTPNRKAHKMHVVLDRFLTENSTLDSVMLVSHMPLICYLLDEILDEPQANLFDTSSMAIIDYDRETSTGSLQTFYHPCLSNIEVK